MDNKEFYNFRQKLQKTQKQLSQLLGISNKAVQSYEQGWRNIPAQVERQVILFLALKAETSGQAVPCWEIRRCAPEMRACVSCLGVQKRSSLLIYQWHSLPREATGELGTKNGLV